MGSLRGTAEKVHPPTSSFGKGRGIKGVYKRGGAPLTYISPSPCKERGTKGERLVTSTNKLYYLFPPTALKEGGYRVCDYTQ